MNLTDSGTILRRIKDWYIAVDESVEVQLPTQRVNHKGSSGSATIDKQVSSIILPGAAMVFYLLALTE